MFNLSFVLHYCYELLKDSDIPSYKLDAEVLLASVIGITRDELLFRIITAAEASSITKTQLTKLKTLIERRVAREPISKILGEKEFWSLKFIINEHVLSPRPETEILVECVLKELKNHSGEKNKQIDQNKSVKILDLGTGSGCIILSLMHEAKNSELAIKINGTGVDISADALKVTKMNSDALYLSDHLSLIHSDWYTNLYDDKGNIDTKYDIIVSNPPYISSADFDNLAIEVKKYDPEIALTDKQDGLTHYRTIISNAHNFLNTDGLIFLEIGFDQHAAIKEIINQNPHLKLRSIIKDLSGIERVVIVELV